MAEEFAQAHAVVMNSATRSVSELRVRQPC
jgi:hypothetical protein